MGKALGVWRIVNEKDLGRSKRKVTMSYDQRSGDKARHWTRIAFQGQKRRLKVIHG
jgi:hypothetical protein